MPIFLHSHLRPGEPMTIDYSELDSFVIFDLREGEGHITDNEGNETSLQAGEPFSYQQPTREVEDYWRNQIP